LREGLGKSREIRNLTSHQQKTKGLQPFPQGGRDSISFSRTIERRLRRGEISIDARLDLHGMTQSRSARGACAIYRGPDKKSGAAICLLSRVRVKPIVACCAQILSVGLETYTGCCVYCGLSIKLLSNMAAAARLCDF